MDDAYQNFSIPEFMQNPHFRSWVLDEDPSATLFWQEWLATHPDRAADVETAKDLLEGIRLGFNDITDAELESRIQATVAALENRNQFLENSGPPTQSPTRLRATWLVATGLVLALLAGWYAFWPGEAATPEVLTYQRVIERGKPSFREVVNTTAAPRKVLLPDSSYVTLAPKGRLSYDIPSADKARRVVYLTGEAFFEVGRNPARPFLVYANGIVTKVLGTSFTVKAYEDETDITVAVRSGRVSVFAPDKSATTTARDDNAVFEKLDDGIVLTANQQATYRPESNRLLKTIVAQQAVIHPEKLPTQTVFEEVPVSRILDQLEAGYSITIIYNELDMKDCLLTAKFTDETLQDKIKLICASIGATYETIDAQIIVTGSGCK